ALMAFPPDKDVVLNAEKMERALKSVRTGESTRATRTVELNGAAVKEGATIRSVAGALWSSGPDEEAALGPLVDRMELEACGIVTLYYGADVMPEQAANTAEQIRRRYPDIEVEVVEGGQAHYTYILGAE